MSKRAIEHNMPLTDILADLVDAVSFGGHAINATASNLPQVNRAVSLVSSGIQSLRDRIAADEEKHLIAKHSDLGWKLVSNLEGLEGQVGRISMINLRAQESAFLKHQLAMDSVSKSGAVGDGGAGGKNQNDSNNKGKGLPPANTNTEKPQIKSEFTWKKIPPPPTPKSVTPSPPGRQKFQNQDLEKSTPKTKPARIRKNWKLRDPHEAQGFSHNLQKTPQSKKKEHQPRKPKNCS